MCLGVCACASERACTSLPGQREYGPETGVPHKRVYTMACPTRAHCLAGHWIPPKQTWGWTMRKSGDICHHNIEWATRLENGDVPVTPEDAKQQQAGITAGLWLQREGSPGSAAEDPCKAPKGIRSGLRQWPSTSLSDVLGISEREPGYPACWSQQVSRCRHCPFWRLGRKPSLLSTFDIVLEGDLLVSRWGPWVWGNADTP